MDGLLFIWRRLKGTWTVSNFCWNNATCPSIRKIDGAICQSMKPKHLIINTLSSICAAGKVDRVIQTNPTRATRKPAQDPHRHPARNHFQGTQVTHLPCHKRPSFVSLSSNGYGNAQLRRNHSIYKFKGKKQTKPKC